MAQPERALSDAELVAIFNEDRADLSLLSGDEHERLLALTEQEKPDPSLLKRIQQDIRPMASHSPFTARAQANEHPGQYVNEMLRNVPGDLIEQGKNLATGTYDLLSVLAKATGEVGYGTGNFLREAVGLDPNESAGTENLRALGRVPGAIVSHYGQYADPDVRAERVREHPVGMAIDMAPVSAALKTGGTAVRATARAAKKAPGRALDTAIGLYRHSPQAVANGIAGRGPVETARSVFAKMTAPEATPPVAAPAAPAAPPASSPAPPAPSAARSAPAAPPVPIVGSGRSPQMLQNELGIQARRQQLTLTEPQYKAATALVQQGKSPAEAVAEVARRTEPPQAQAPPQSGSPSATPAGKKKKAPASAKLTADEADEYLRLTEKGMSNDEAVAFLLQQRSLLKRLGAGTKPGDAVRRDVAERNTTGRWPK